MTADVGPEIILNSGKTTTTTKSTLLIKTKL